MCAVEEGTGARQELQWIQRSGLERDLNNAESSRIKGGKEQERTAKGGEVVSREGGKACGVALLFYRFVVLGRKEDKEGAYEARVIGGQRKAR